MSSVYHNSLHQVAIVTSDPSPVAGRSPPFAEVFGPTRSGRRTPAAIYSETHSRTASGDRSDGEPSNTSLGGVDEGGGGGGTVSSIGDAKAVCS